MKITFNSNDDYIEFVKTGSNKIMIVISAKDFNNSLKTIVNSAEITEQQFQELMNSLNLSSLTS